MGLNRVEMVDENASEDKNQDTVGVSARGAAESGHAATDM